jgi:hypothetical protein
MRSVASRRTTTPETSSVVTTTRICSERRH